MRTKQEARRLSTTDDYTWKNSLDLLRSEFHSTRADSNPPEKITNVNQEKDNRSDVQAKTQMLKRGQNDDIYNTDVTSNEATTGDIVGNSRLQWRNIYF
ncbi:hypothetical protein E3N88_25561 [Mikania micrantha]|uniref:Uncharacterized protein n=1 Tax=Mikania micrantha TaxID=192012 RepID=A0A5N6N6K4_9ASTR|nr:hypothetical protein E3N88_25561 [Mikania micrantha]